MGSLFIKFSIGINILKNGSNNLNQAIFNYNQTFQTFQIPKIIDLNKILFKITHEK